MVRTFRGVVLALVCSLSFGCGGSEPPPAPPQPAGGAGDSGAGGGEPAEGGSSSARPLDGDAALQVVRQFLESVRRGEQEAASAMLTPLAKERTEAMELYVAPPGSDTASYEVTEVELVDEQTAHVASTWTDLDEAGQPQTDVIVWFLKVQDAGWRIAGMATRVFDNEPPLFLDFENPEDMLRKQQLAEEEMIRRMQAAEAEAGGGEGEAPAADETPRQASRERQPLRQPQAGEEPETAQQPPRPRAGQRRQ